MASTPPPSSEPEYGPENRPYAPRGQALALLKSRAPELLLSGPAGTGKSRACLEKLHAAATLFPGARALIVRKCRASLSETALVTFEHEVLPEGHPLLVGPRRSHRLSYDYGNGSSLVLGGLDRPTKVMSSEYDLIYVQEAIELAEGDWEALSTRLRHGRMPFQQLLADTNPDTPTHWLRRRADDGPLVLLEGRFEDNPRFWDAGRADWTEQGRTYIDRLDALTGPRKLRLRYGRWVAAEGVVYEEFDRRVHLVDRFAIPPEWRRIRAIDFGYSNPFVCQWWALDGDGRMFLYRELYMSRRTVRDHARQVLDLSRGERIEATVADHDAEGRAQLDALGVTTVKAHKPVGPGIEGVRERLRPAGDGRARLFVLRDALVERDRALVDAKLPCCTAEEFDAYLWKHPRAGRRPDEGPIQLHDHGMDALRYACAFLDRRGVRRLEVY